MDELIKQRDNDDTNINQVLTTKACHATYSQCLDRQLNDAKAIIKETMENVEDVLGSYASQLAMRLYSTDGIDKEKAYELHEKLPSRDEITRLCKDVMNVFEQNVNNGIRNKIEGVQMVYNTLSTDSIDAKGTTVDAVNIGATFAYVADINV